MLRNTPNQQLHIIAFDSQGRVTGEAANITCQLSIDGGARVALADTSATEIGTTGEYVFDLSQAETDGHALSFTPACSTQDVNVLSMPSNVIYTFDADAITDGVLSGLEGVEPAVVRSFDPITKTIGLVRGDSYLQSVGTAIEIAINIPTAVDPSEITLAIFTADHKSVASQIIGTVEIVEIAGQATARIEFEKTATADKQFGEYEYDVEIEYEGENITVLRGVLRLLRDHVVS